MAKYKKKTVRQLRQDRFRDTTMLLADQLAEKVAGRGKQILYVLVGIVVLAGLVYGIVRWRQKHAAEAEQAMGRAIKIARGEVTTTPPINPKDPVFSTEQERANRAIEEFQKVAVKYGEPYRSEANYFIATSRLVVEPAKGESELQGLSQGTGDVAVLAKFALAQTKQGAGKLDEAAALYSEIAKLNSNIVPPESANLQLAGIYQKQGKRKEAADLLFGIVQTSRNARDAEGKPIQETAASRQASQELLKLDPARHAQLPAAADTAGFPF